MDIIYLDRVDLALGKVNLTYSRRDFISGWRIGFTLVELNLLFVGRVFSMLSRIYST